LKAHSPGQIFEAWLPYIMLVIFVLMWGYAPMKAQLDRATSLVAVPALHNQIIRMPPVTPQPTPYAAVFTFNWMSASGTACLMAILATALLLRVKPRQLAGIYVATLRQLSLTLVTIACMLGLAYLMNYAGMTSTLGLALAATGKGFPFFSAILGWLGVFLTGSDTSSNAVRKSSGDHGECAAHQPRPDGICQLGSGCDGQDDLPAKHCRRRRGDRDVAR
jgi:lactate permease